VKVVWIGQKIATHFDRFPKVDAHRVGHFIQAFGSSVGQCEVTDSCHRRVPENLVNSSSAQVGLDAPVHYSILLLTGKRCT
jgi:hypothetical protein